MDPGDAPLSDNQRQILIAVEAVREALRLVDRARDESKDADEKAFAMREVLTARRDELDQARRHLFELTNNLDIDKGATRRGREFL